MDEGCIRADAIRVLQALANLPERRRYGLLRHELAKLFGSDVSSMADFQAATKLAYEESWISLDAQYYCLTESGKRLLDQ